MQVGLTNAPATYQCALDMVLTKFKWKTCLNYMNDVIIYSNSVKDNIRHVDDIFTTLAEAGVTLTMNKCTLFTDKVDYLGHVIRPGKIEVYNNHTTSLIQS